MVSGVRKLRERVVLGRGDFMTGTLRRAVELSLVSVGWNTIVGLAAVITAVASGSLSLIGFGINAVIDSSVSVLLIHRFRAEARGHAERAARAEERTEHIAGFAFVLIAAYLAVQAGRALAAGAGHSASVFWHRRVGGLASRLARARNREAPSRPRASKSCAARRQLVDPLRRVARGSDLHGARSRSR